MTNDQVLVLADQVDVLADTVGRLALRVATLVEVLSRDGTAERMGFTTSEIGALKFPTRRIFASSEHRQERERRASSTARETAIDCLIREHKLEPGAR